MLFGLEAIARLYFQSALCLAALVWGEGHIGETEGIILDNAVVFPTETVAGTHAFCLPY